jgi:hypothetical protein
MKDSLPLRAVAQYVVTFRVLYHSKGLRVQQYSARRIYSHSQKKLAPLCLTSTYSHRSDQAAGVLNLVVVGSRGRSFHFSHCHLNNALTLLFSLWLGLHRLNQ